MTRWRLFASLFLIALAMLAVAAAPSGQSAVDGTAAAMQVPLVEAAVEEPEPGLLDGPIPAMSPTPAVAPSPPVAPAHSFDGERLVYELGWNGVVAGEAEVTVTEAEYNGARCYHIVMLLTTRPVVDWIWKVRDKVEVFTEIDTLRPLYYAFQQREGAYVHDTDIVFDHEKKTAIAIRRYKGKVKKKLVTFDELYDPLTALFVMRSVPMEPGEFRQYKVFDGKRVHTIEYAALERESIRTETSGKERTTKFRPRILASDPPKKKKKGEEVDATVEVGQVYFWADTDPGMRIYHVESQVSVGRVEVNLVKD